MSGRRSLAWWASSMPLALHSWYAWCARHPKSDCWTRSASDDLGGPPGARGWSWLSGWVRRAQKSKGLLELRLHRTRRGAESVGASSALGLEGHKASRSLDG